MIEFILTYFYDPVDLLPDENETLFGYLDDAYLIALAYERVAKTFAKQGSELSDFEGRFMNELKMIKRSVQCVIPEEAKQISDLVEQVSSSEADAACCSIS